MKMIFAQGNPGSQYARSRHNTGFMAVDALAKEAGSPWRTETKFKAQLAEVAINGEKVLLVKPLSYYNETGQVARAIIDFYKLDPAEDFLVIHDELALPFGAIRIREKGSDAGNNGIKSLNSHLGPDYARLRVGIWNELRDQIDDAHFVLASFTQKEHEQLETLISQKIIPLIHDFVDGKLEITSHKP